MTNVTTPNGFKLDNAGRRVVVDPVTRIEGHLRVEVNVDSNNVIRNAVSTGTMWRGIEVILKGRDPRDAWAFTQRICGVCTGTHALTSVRAVENALKINVPENANTIRNIMQLALYVHDHLVHFYHLHALDWVDVVSALKADPKATSALAQSISPWPMSSPGYFKDLQIRLTKFVESGQLGPFKNGYWGHPAYKLPPEANLMAVAHYLEALDFQKEIVKIHTIYGGKNPHPNWLVGGVPCSINVDGTGAVGAINIERLNLVSSIIDQTVAFVEQVYVPDLVAIAGFYKDWLYGGGLSSKSVMSYGDLPEYANDYSDKSLMLPRGVIINGNLNEVLPVDLSAPDQIQEFVTHSWYKYADEGKGLHPYDGVTEPNFVLGPNAKGTRTNIEALDESAKYSFLKAPRWKGHAVEVGPLARYIIGYAQGKPEFKEPTEKLLKTLDVPVTALFSTLGRTAARGLECQWAARKLRAAQDKLMASIKAGDLSTANTDKWHPSSWPKDVKGVGFTEAPRGALAHWVKIKDTRIDNYQCVVPTTWNGSPRDPQGNIGAFEAALLDTPMADPNQPLEIIRTLHSFDPCLACSTHVMSEDGQEMAQVKVS
ncbi:MULTISPECIES: nickel-dependent hydrogenase large subunit [Rhodopseudomonas]|jgi:hydrogenase large subunit|uniref:Uptake hydrogenase large subunit n=2 Tax=Rhodopseudomonas palustris TaxID=1076 RepID=Q6NB67_RHOPA|nr:MULTISPECIES: nickel-dependent hydrogenase large subunit [Rhodopseudomonas]AVT75068.1 hydrogenase 2 large subunit [Rhodopseudomonas palustris]AVT79855.1 hydrogenase 2 large subunit [Rhodopseudomonas palustris]NEW97719.1 nickel-dependent hydrogenase large subunit [Rhodopseudomonas sp. BR0G17]OPF91746.1 hydrogenase 2 large subunit [Rhodopseudomonas palustris]PPQ44621.1 nickel-dependent hydrogenase large subunit [Rhodopseudomonas palustris]